MTVSDMSLTPAVQDDLRLFDCNGTEINVVDRAHTRIALPEPFALRKVEYSDEVNLQMPFDFVRATRTLDRAFRLGKC